jgi:hypothetical protein
MYPLLAEFILKSYKKLRHIKGRSSTQQVTYRLTCCFLYGMNINPRGGAGINMNPQEHFFK